MQRVSTSGTALVLCVDAREVRTWVETPMDTIPDGFVEGLADFNAGRTMSLDQAMEDPPTDA